MSNRQKWFVILGLFVLGAIAGVTAQSAPPINTSLLTIPVTTLNAAPVTGANLQVVGTAGQGFYCYWAVANYPIGSVLSALGCVTNGPNTLTSGNYVALFWQNPASVTSIDILRTSSNSAPSGTCNCAVATAVTSGTANDQSNSLSTYTVTLVAPQNYNLTLSNETVGSDATHLILRQGATYPGVKILDLSLSGTGSPSPPLNSLQFDNGGAFGGSVNLEWNTPAANILGLNQTAIGFPVQIGQVASGTDWGGFTGYTSLLIGSTVSQTAPGPTYGAIEIHSTWNDGGIMMWNHNNSAPFGPAELGFMKSRGTQASPLAVNSDLLGDVGFNGYNGTAYKVSAEFAAQANGLWSGTNQNSTLQFQTTPFNSTSEAEVLRLGWSDASSLYNDSELNLAVNSALCHGWLVGTLSSLLDTCFWKLAPGSVALGNGTPGNSSGTLTLSTVTSASTINIFPVGSGFINAGGELALQPPDIASGGNPTAIENSPKLVFTSGYQTGSSTFGQDFWSLQVGIGSGTNGTSTLIANHIAGTSGSTAFVSQTFDATSYCLGGAQAGGTPCASKTSDSSFGIGNGTPGDISGTLFLTRVHAAPGLVSALVACSSTTEGSIQAVTNSATTTWGATISSTGTNHVLAYCDGTNWTVMAQ